VLTGPSKTMQDCPAIIPRSIIPPEKNPVSMSLPRQRLQQGLEIGRSIIDRKQDTDRHTTGRRAILWTVHADLFSSNQVLPVWQFRASSKRRVKYGAFSSLSLRPLGSDELARVPHEALFWTEQQTGAGAVFLPPMQLTVPRSGTGHAPDRSSNVHQHSE
jgi:hypothetical protein